MKNIYSILVFLFLSQILKGQTDEEPRLIKMSYSEQKAREPIIFTFPDSLYSLASEYLKLDTDSTSKLNIELSPFDGGLFAIVRTRRINPAKVKDFINDPVEKLLSSTNRYCIINGEKVPVYYESDVTLGHYNFVFTGSPLTIILKYKPGEGYVFGGYFIPY
ncbi:MAG: hypothetical protein PHU33_14895 [Bacteroidales bacterium]|jgi:hypothetical protein|nr:hypothetical protein [Bacteroidales bacterium]